MGKARPFLEVFASLLNEDYRFPVLEIVAFIFFLGPFTGFWIFSPPGPQSELTIADLIGGFSTFLSMAFVAPVFGILILRNIAHGFGNELERGVIQHLLSYPLKRRSLLTARILSSIGVVFMLLLGIMVFTFYVVAPDITFTYIVPIWMASMAFLSYPFLVASIVLILTLFFKRGSIALMVGIVLYFSSFFLIMILLITVNVKILAIIYPSIALQFHYQAGWDPSALKLWTPSFIEACLYIGAGYALAILILMVGYLYFDRKLEI